MSKTVRVLADMLEQFNNTMNRILDEIAAMRIRLDEIAAVDNADWFVRPILPQGENPGQDYFYSAEWQAAEAEAEADEDERLGRYVRFESAEEAKQHLKSLIEKWHETDDPRDSLRIAVLEGQLGHNIPVEDLWEGIDDEPRDPAESFERSWRDAQDGKTHPIETLWDKVYDDDIDPA